MIAAIVQLIILIILCLYMATGLLYVAWPLVKHMNFQDGCRRLGPVAIHLSIALAGVLLLLGVHAEWRLPVINITLIFTAIGIQRDVKRERKKRKGR